MITVGRKHHDIRICGRIVRACSAEQSVCYHIEEQKEEITDDYRCTFTFVE